MTFIRFRTKDGILHVPTREIAQVLQEPAGTAKVLLKNGTIIAAGDATKLIEILREADDGSVAPNETDQRSLFQMIFG